MKKELTRGVALVYMTSQGVDPETFTADDKKEYAETLMEVILEEGGVDILNYKDSDKFKKFSDGDKEDFERLIRWTKEK